MFHHYRYTNLVANIFTPGNGSPSPTNVVVVVVVVVVGDLVVIRR